MRSITGFSQVGSEHTILMLRGEGDGDSYQSAKSCAEVLGGQG